MEASNATSKLQRNAQHQGMKEGFVDDAESDGATGLRVCRGLWWWSWSWWLWMWFETQSSSMRCATHKAT